jgi:hypothetical protein
MTTTSRGNPASRFWPVTLTASLLLIIVLAFAALPFNARASVATDPGVEIIAGCGQVSGHKYDETGAPVSWWQIQLRNESGVTLATTYTAATTGYYEFTGLSDGVYWAVEIMRTGWTNITAVSREINVCCNGGSGIAGGTDAQLDCPPCQQSWTAEFKNRRPSTATPTATAKTTATSTATSTATNTPTYTPTDTPTNTPTATPTNTPTSTSTWTPTSTSTATRTGTPTKTSTPTATATVATCGKVSGHKYDETGSRSAGGRSSSEVRAG